MRDAKKVFEDAAKTWASIERTAAGLTMRYQRVYGASCSLRADEAADVSVQMTAAYGWLFI